MGKSSHTRIITWGDIAHNTVRRPDNTAHQARNTVRRPDRVGPGSVRGVQGATGRDRTRSVRGVLVDHIFLKKREKRKEKKRNELALQLVNSRRGPGHVVGRPGHPGQRTTGRGLWIYCSTRTGPWSTPAIRPCVQCFVQKSGFSAMLACGMIVRTLFARAGFFHATDDH